MAQANPLLTLIRDLGSRPIASPSTPRPLSPVKSAHADLVRKLMVITPHTIVHRADDVDLEVRGSHMCAVIAAVSDYLGILVHEVATKSPVTADLTFVESMLSDLQSDICGTLDQAAEKVREENRECSGRVS